MLWSSLTRRYARFNSVYLKASRSGDGPRRSSPSLGFRWKSSTLTTNEQTNRYVSVTYLSTMMSSKQITLSAVYVSTCIVTFLLVCNPNYKLVSSSSLPKWRGIVNHSRVRHRVALHPNQKIQVTSSSTSTTAVTTVTPPLYSSTVIAQENPGAPVGRSSVELSQEKSENNVLIQLAKHLWSNVIVQFKDDTVQLFTNYQTCNEIKRQRKQYVSTHSLEERRLRKRYNGTTLHGITSLSSSSSSPNDNKNEYYIRTGLSYWQHRFLKQGQQDLTKLMRLFVVSYFGMLPYAFMLFPESIKPSPFLHSSTNASGESHDDDKWNCAVQSRIHTCISTLCNVEREITLSDTVAVAQSALPFFSLFGGSKKKNKQQEQLLLLKFITKNLETKYWKGFTSSKHEDSSHQHEELSEEKSENFYQDLASVVCKSTQQQLFTKAEKSLSDVPPSLIRGLSNMIFSANPSTFSNTNSLGKQLDAILPLFIIKNRLVKHLSELEEQDNFLLYEQIPLDSLKKDDVREACHARCIGSSTDSLSTLRLKLANWLTLEEKMLSLNTEPCYYNANLARTYMMCINALQSTAEDYNFGKLPRLLYSQ